MLLNALLAALAVGYGLYTAYVRATSPEKFGKLAAMQKRWGPKVGYVLHLVAYTLLPLVVGATLAQGVFLAWQRPADSDGFVVVDDADPEMNAAIATARSQVDTFITRLSAPQPGDRLFSVKVPIQDGEATEHFWLEDVYVDGETVRGLLGNDPQLVTGYQYGDPVSASIREVSDWMYVADDRLVGGFTIRVLRSRMDPSERGEFDAQMDFAIEADAATRPAG